jgi:hypothetical protein
LEILLVSGVVRRIVGGDIVGGAILCLPTAVILYAGNTGFSFCRNHLNSWIDLAGGSVCD